MHTCICCTSDVLTGSPIMDYLPLYLVFIRMVVEDLLSNNMTGRVLAIFSVFN